MGEVVSWKEDSAKGAISLKSLYENQQPQPPQGVYSRFLYGIRW
jgi:hypothetical protein